MTRKDQLYTLASRIFEDSVGGAFWDADHDRLVNKEEGDYFLKFQGDTIQLESDEYDIVLAELYEMCDMCAYCGWVWWMDEMDEKDGELACAQCYSEEEY